MNVSPVFGGGMLFFFVLIIIYFFFSICGCVGETHNAAENGVGFFFLILNFSTPTLP